MGGQYMIEKYMGMVEICTLLSAFAPYEMQKISQTA